MNLELFAGRACELKKMNNAPILFGKIDRVAGDRMEVAGVKEQLPEVACGQHAKILIYDETGGFEVLIGRIDDWEPFFFVSAWICRRAFMKFTTISSTGRSQFGSRASA